MKYPITKNEGTPWSSPRAYLSERIFRLFVNNAKYALPPLLAGTSVAQVVIPDGTTVTTASTQVNETIIVNGGDSVAVDGNPAVVLDDDGSALYNSGSISTTGVTSTVQSAANNTTITNQSGATISGASRAVDIVSGDGATINNSGQILGSGDQRNGTVYTDANAQNVTVNNLTGGVIDAGAGNQGSGFGQEIAPNGNTFELDNDGTIQGRGQASAASNLAGDGVRIGNVGNVGEARVTITNSGAIDSESDQGTTAGVRFVNGVSFNGTLTNEAGGTISGDNNGLYFGNAVNGQGADHSNGVVNNEGTISSDSRALNIDGTGLTVNNSGSILGTGNQRNGTVYADSTAQDFTLNNQTGGTIDAGGGNEGAGFSTELSEAGNDFTITNSGTIAGRGNAGAGLATAGDGIRLERTRVGGALDGTTTGLFNGTITNNAGASITSEGANGTVAGFRAVNGVSFQGTLNNAGTISGTQNGVYFGNAVPAGGADHTGGVVNNLAGGVISSDSRALNIDGTGLTVNNAGSILGTGDQRNGTAYSDGTADNFTLNNQTGGVIDAGAGNTGSGFAAEIGQAADGETTFTLDNDGTIQGRGQGNPGDGSAADGVRIGNAGNTGTFDGTITNSGLIDSESDVGTTGGVRVVNGVNFEGTLTNETGGTISGDNNGVYFGTGTHTGTVTNQTGATISSDSRALNIDGTDLTVNNSGSILGTGDQRNGTVYADSTAQDFTLNNQTGGLIDAGAGNDGAGFSAELDDAGNDFTITNNGTIAGRGNAGAGTATAGDGIRLERERVGGALDGTTTGLFNGTITNNAGASITSEGANGTVAGIRAVNGVSFQGTLNNAGTISGTQNGVYFGNAVPAGGADHTGGVVNNLAGGVISSDSRALNIDGTGLTVNNAGSILGTGNQRNGTAYSDGTADDFTLNNQTGGTIDAGAGNTGSGFAAEIGGAIDGANTFALNNDGTIQGRGQGNPGDGSAADGVRIGNAGNTGDFDGTITNSGLIDSESDQGTTGGIRVVNGVNFEGTLTNESGGTISGDNNGVYFGTGTHTGTVNNQSGATISSDSRAFNVDGDGLTVNNAGRIIGTGNQRNGTVYFDGTADNATFNNQAGGLVDAGAGNQGSGVSIEIEGGTTQHSITNAGSIVGRGADLPSGASAGVRLFGVGINQPQFYVADVDIVNTGVISSENSAGILIEDLNFTGSITNSGSISGATASIDTTTALGDITIDQNSGSLVGDVLTGAGNDTLNINGVSNLTGNINLGAGANTVNVLAAGTANIAGQTISNSDLNVNGTLGLSAENPLTVDGATIFANGSTLSLSVADVDAVDTNAPTTVLTSNGGVTDNGLSVVDNSLFVDFENAAVVGGNALQVQAANADLGGLINDSNVVSLANQLQADLGVNNNAAFTQLTGQLDALDANAFETAAAQLLPDLSTGSVRELYEHQSGVFNAIGRRLAQPNSGKGAWFEVVGRSADRDGGSDTSNTGYDADSYGFTLGYDRSVSDSLVLGGAFSYSEIEVNAGASETDIDAYSFNLYGQYDHAETGGFVRGALAYGVGDADLERQSIAGDIDGDYDLDQFSVEVVGGLNKQFGAHTVTPFAAFEYATISRDSYSENGGLGLSVSDSDVDIAQLGIGVDHAVAFKVNEKPLTWRSSLAYYYDLLDEEESFSARVAGGSSAFGLSTDTVSEDKFELSTGLELQLSENSLISLGYEGVYTSDFEGHSGFARFALDF